MSVQSGKYRPAAGGMSRFRRTGAAGTRGWAARARTAAILGGVRCPTARRNANGVASAGSDWRDLLARTGCETGTDVLHMYQQLKDCYRERDAAQRPRQPSAVRHGARPQARSQAPEGAKRVARPCCTWGVFWRPKPGAASSLLPLRPLAAAGLPSPEGGAVARRQPSAIAPGSPAGGARPPERRAGAVRAVRREGPLVDADAHAAPVPLLRRGWRGGAGRRDPGAGDLPRLPRPGRDRSR